MPSPKATTPPRTTSNSDVLPSRTGGTTAKPRRWPRFVTTGSTGRRTPPLRITAGNGGRWRGAPLTNLLSRQRCARVCPQLRTLCPRTKRKSVRSPAFPRNSAAGSSATPAAWAASSRAWASAALKPRPLFALGSVRNVKASCRAGEAPGALLAGGTLAAGLLRRSGVSWQRFRPPLRQPSSLFSMVRLHTAAGSIHASRDANGMNSLSKQSNGCKPKAPKKAQVSAKACSRSAVAVAKKTTATRKPVLAKPTPRSYTAEELWDAEDATFFDPIFRSSIR